jgi:hypothetical protein
VDCTSQTSRHSCYPRRSPCYSSTYPSRYGYSGVTVVLQWCSSGVSDFTVVVLQWCYSGGTVLSSYPSTSGYSGVTVDIQWCFSGVTVVLKWCYSVEHLPIEIWSCTDCGVVKYQWCHRVVSDTYCVRERHTHAPFFLKLLTGVGGRLSRSIKPMQHHCNTTALPL